MEEFFSSEKRMKTTIYFNHRRKEELNSRTNENTARKYKHRIIIPINNRVTLLPPPPPRNNTANLFAPQIVPIHEKVPSRINFQKRIKRFREDGVSGQMAGSNRWSKFLSIIGQFRVVAVNRRQDCSVHVFAKRLRMKLIRRASIDVSRVAGATWHDIEFTGIYLRVSIYNTIYRVCVN